MTQDWKIDTFDALTAGDGLNANANTVLVVTDSLEGVSEIGETLIKLGYRVQVSLASGHIMRGMPMSAPDAILLALDNLLDQAEPILKAIRNHIQSPLVPVIGYLGATIERPETLDSVLFKPCHPQQIATRVDAMIRLQSMQHEIMRRGQVLRLGFDQDYALSESALGRELRVLFIGKAKPEFMIVLNAMRERNVEVVAAFTSFTAFDYLHGREFDAVIIDAMDAAEPASSILSSMQRNVRLFHVPKIVMVRKDKTSPCPQDLLDKATDIVSSSDPTEEITNRILEPANYHRMHSQLKAEFEGMGGKTARDPDTGLYNREYLEAYLDFLSNEGEERTVCVVRLMPSASFSVDDAFVRVATAQAGGFLAGLVRVNDLVARLSDDSFAIAVPKMSESQIYGLTQRVIQVIECAAFESGKKGAGAFTMNVNLTIEDGNDPLPAATRVSRLLAA